MPVGVTWGQYLRFFTAAMVSMMAGSQLVHAYYKPLKDLDTYIEKELKDHNIVDGSANGNSQTKS